MFGIQSNLTLKLLELETSNLVYCFFLGKASGRSNNFPPTRHGLGHVTRKIFWNTIKRIFKTTWARDFKFGAQLHLGKTVRELK